VTAAWRSGTPPLRLGEAVRVPEKRPGRATMLPGRRG